MIYRSVVEHPQTITQREWEHLELVLASVYCPVQFHNGPVDMVVIENENIPVLRFGMLAGEVCDVFYGSLHNVRRWRALLK
jgi:hypothetical protein